MFADALIVCRGLVYSPEVMCALSSLSLISLQLIDVLSLYLSLSLSLSLPLSFSLLVCAQVLDVAFPIQRYNILRNHLLCLIVYLCWSRF